MTVSLQRIKELWHDEEIKAKGQPRLHKLTIWLAKLAKSSHMIASVESSIVSEAIDTP